MKTTLPFLIMKSLPLFLALFAVSCASKTPAVVKIKPSPTRHLSRSGAESIRLPETLKAYPLGRYADPHHRGIMHEAHTIYRVETTPKWNLTSRERASAATTSAAPGAAQTELSANELLVELNRQREATQSVMRSGHAVSSKLADLATLFQHNRQVLVEQNAGIRKELQTTRERLETLEKQAGDQPAPETLPSSDDDPW